jgi:hypothetical protein
MLEEIANTTGFKETAAGSLALADPTEVSQQRSSPVR